MTRSAEPRGDGLPATDPLAILEVIDRLEVGPVTLRPDRLQAPYRVVRDGGEEVFELVYRYAEEIFDPRAAADRNLAAMIGVQVAINYGLFCREIVFHGPFDQEDRRFLKRMVENTAREIYVKKILEPNPFLLETARGLPAIRRRRYSRASLRFEDGETGGPPAPKEAGWNVDVNRFAILSSGGKDSLLSYGLLAELGCETHPVFVNESGRHWFRALKAFRHFQHQVQHTARVWVNCDRLFSWMLRHLPFVRRDFHSVRSDEYPIRLWTVGVFLFGALPLLRRHGVGRLVVGDEYDTTARARYRGIANFDGLYDQSLEFDHALSRFFFFYFWGFTQFSLLRPLSELLIQRILAERYPRLLRLQISCHSASAKGEDVHPCGKCEKCRRIAGMLIALGADPVACGYSREQCEKLLPALAEHGVHQERPAAEHLAYLLREPRLGRAPARRRPEAVKLRFHPKIAPIDEIPVELREPIYRIFLEHAEGAIERLGRAWIDFDVLASGRLLRPYGFDRPGDGGKTGGGETGGGETGGGETGGGETGHLWGELSWPQAEKRLQEVDVALLPVGAIEQHGPHLPLDTDSFDADYLARRVAAGCSEPRPLVLPLIPYGVSYHHEDFRGTLSVSNQVLAQLVYEIGMSAARNGIRKLVIVNGHGGNAPTLQYAAQTINRDAHIFTCVDTGETSDKDVEAMTETPGDVHAGEIETSTSLALRPHLVRMEAAETCVPRFSSRFLDFASERSVDWYARTQKLSESGVLGDPSKASAEKGEKIWRVSIDHLVELVEHLKALSLEEIYERRY